MRRRTDAFVSHKGQGRRTGMSRGFSLVELMVALALSTFLLGGLILTYISGRAAAADAENLSRLQENMRFVSDHLLRDVRNAGFRDQGSLLLSQANQIADNYARIEGGNRLVIQYAGRSHCAQRREAFVNLVDELKVIRNAYFVANGRLVCSGSANGGTPVSVDLVAGVAGVQFAFVRPVGAAVSSSCTYLSNDDLLSACTGVEVTVTFEGIGQGDRRQAVFRSSFRNVLLERIYGRPT
jgi:prepilin-type N-terminal cleavage/methylation domain-containing protein